MISRADRLAVLRTAQRLLDNPKTSDKVRNQQLAIVLGCRQHG